MATRRKKKEQIREPVGVEKDFMIWANTPEGEAARIDSARDCRPISEIEVRGHVLSIYGAACAYCETLRDVEGLSVSVTIANNLTAILKYLDQVG